MSTVDVAFTRRLHNKQNIHYWYCGFVSSISSRIWPYTLAGN